MGTSKNAQVKDLSSTLTEGEARLNLFDKYYAGEQPLSFLAPEARTALSNRFGRMSTNIARLAVNSLTERLRVTGFTRDGVPDADVWSAWKRNDLDQLAPTAHREAFVHGRSFVLVWADGQGNAQVTVESARQMAVKIDPATRRVVKALKRWVSGGHAYATLFSPEDITTYRSRSNTVTDASQLDVGVWDELKTWPNPLGVVPVVPFVNTDRLLDNAGRSELTDLMPLIDALNKILADIMVSSEYAGRPRRWASGVELTERPVIDSEGNPTGEMETVNPYPESNRMMISEEENAKFGQLPAADLKGYEEAVRVFLGQIMAVSALPAHYVGIFSANPASADALRATEASLTARVESRQSAFGPAWEQVARLILGVEKGLDPRTLEVGVQWADAATRSVAQEADAVVKLFGAGLLPQSYALKRLGYSDDDITSIRIARRAEALDTAGTDLKALLP